MILKKHSEILLFVFFKMKIFNRAERYSLFSLYGRIHINLKILFVWHCCVMIMENLHA